MDWIVDHFQIVLVVLIGIGTWLKSRMDARTNETNDTPFEPEENFPPVAERRRPPSVPPPLDRSATRPSLPFPMAESEAARETSAALKHQHDLDERLRQIRETKATTSGGAAVTRARIASKRSGKPTPLAAMSLQVRMRDPKELRRAIVMREILDPPVSLR